MRRMYTPWLTLLMLLFIPVTAAFGQMSNYYFSASEGEPTNMEGSSALFKSVGPGSDWQGGYQTVYQMEIGFPFIFNGSEYTSLSVSTQGVVYFGTHYFTDWYGNWMTGGYTYPMLAPFWDDLFVSGGSIWYTECSEVRPLLHYVVTGREPNRVLTIEWQDTRLTRWQWGQAVGTFQVRLHETSNRIEFWYGRMSPKDVCPVGGGSYNTSATIGIAGDWWDFMSVSLEAGSSPTMSRTQENNWVDLVNTPIEKNTLLSFGQCYTVLNGRLGEGNGGTSKMADGDTFFEGFETTIGESSVYTPFALQMVDPICNSSYTLEISGPAAGDYYFGTPGTTWMEGEISNGSIAIPEITFEPTDAGLREATLTVNALGITRTFNLAAYAPFVNYIGHIDEGGTPKMKTGDALLVDKRVDRRNTGTFSPFTMRNMSSTEVPVTYTITGGFGQYSIAPETMIGPGEELTPVITFNALGFGPQVATLEVRTGSEMRTFTLNAISAAPGGEFRIGEKLVDTSSTLFTNITNCVGGDPHVLTMQMVNTGYGKFTITGAAFYETDTTIRQGIPRYAFLRDANGNLIPSNDYAISLQPNGTGTENIFPITLDEGYSQTFYVTFIGREPGKRYARAYLITNSENTAAPDVNGEMTEGLVAFDVFGRGLGSRLSDRTSGGLPKAIVFPAARLGNTTEKVLNLVNNGACSLRISLDKMQITSGDVDEFKVISKPSKYIDPATGDLVLAPGESDKVVLAFTPTQVGSHRAGLRLATNDSTIYIPGVTERGTYYVDLYGGGGTDLYADGIEFGQALMGGMDVDYRHGIVRVVNTMNVPLTVASISIEGSDAAEFREDPAMAWPAAGTKLMPGEVLELGVLFAPIAGGTTGPRNANLKVATAAPDFQAVAPLTGEAGTRTMQVSPQVINFPTTAVNRFQRHTIMITNTGTMPMRITMPEVAGPDAANFKLGKLERMEIAPGQTEHFEITYMPLSPNTTINTSLMIGGNATNAPMQVMLNATSKAKGPDTDNPSIAVTGGNRGNGVIEDDVNAGEENLSLSNIASESVAAGMTLRQSQPNPAQELTEIRYSIKTAVAVELALYDGAGRLVRVLDAGVRTGEQVVRVDVRDLANGTYFYRLTANGQTLSRPLSVTR